MKIDIDFDKISNELQNRIDFVIDCASQKPEIDIESCIEAAHTKVVFLILCLFPSTLFQRPGVGRAHKPL